VLDREDIAEIVARFDADRVLYESVAGEVHRRTFNLLHNQALRNVVTSRAKSVESLQRTLTRDRERWSRQDFKELAPPLTDLAGVRVLLYREEDVGPTKDSLVREFQIIKEKDKRSSDGYSAYHIVVHNWRSETEPNPTYIRHLPCEIQICTIVEHVWNELEHDIRYKQPGGRPDANQIELLSSLRAELDLCARTSKRLMQRTEERTRSNNEPITGSHELRRYLEGRLNCRIAGAFDDMFALLSRLLDSITPRSLDSLFEVGQPRAAAEAQQSRTDLDCAHQEVGFVCLMLLPALKPVDVLEVIGEKPAQPLWKFLRRVASEEGIK
jgi:ppGpp synthetase/RelA/SpoT-type nucleotidyltranferase